MLHSATEVVDDAALPLGEVTLFYVTSGIAHESQIERQIVNRCYLHGQQLLCLEEMVQIGFGVNTVDLTSVFIDG